MHVQSFNLEPSSPGSVQPVPVRGLATPRYDRSALEPRIVHLGAGNFHRAHQAVYLDELAALHPEGSWGVIGAGTRTGKLAGELRSQDCLYTVLEREESGDRARLIGSMLGYIAANEDPDALLSALSDPSTQIASLTVTGDGYELDPQADELNVSSPAIRRDLEQPEEPHSVPAILAEALRRRRDAGAGPFTVLSCDNLPRNGEAAKRSVVGFAEALDPSLANWIEANVAFPSSVVDRITPESKPALSRLLMKDYGIGDKCPVATEAFSQWVIEDTFCADRPPLEEVGAELVADCSLHELTKKRLLNGSHCAIAYLGLLASYERIDEAMSDPRIDGFIARFMDEVSALLPTDERIDLDAYKRDLRRRFANPGVADPLARLARRGTTKMPAYLLPSLHEALERGLPHSHLTLAVAAWVRYLSGRDLRGRPVEVEDAKADLARPLASVAGDDPAPILGLEEVFGSLGRDAWWADELREAIRFLEVRGVAGALQTVRQ